MLCFHLFCTCCLAIVLYMPSLAYVVRMGSHIEKRIPILIASEIKTAGLEFSRVHLELSPGIPKLSSYSAVTSFNTHLWSTEFGSGILTKICGSDSRVYLWDTQKIYSTYYSVGRTRKNLAGVCRSMKGQTDIQVSVGWEHLTSMLESTRMALVQHWIFISSCGRVCALGAITVRSHRVLKGSLHIKKAWFCLEGIFSFHLGNQYL